MALGGSNRSAAVGQSFIGQAFRVGVLLLPFTLLAIAALRFPGSNNPMLWLATAFQIIVCLLTFLSGNYGRQAMGPSVITLYLIALCWLWFGDGVDGLRALRVHSVEEARGAAPLARA